MSRAPSELEGFLAGLRHRLAAGPDDPGLRRRLAEAELALTAHAPERALAILSEVEDRLDAREPEEELRERPRGLVSFRRPTADPLAPTPAEEDPLANRLLLVGRLLAVRARAGDRVDDLVAKLRRAEAERRAGRPAVAKKLVDEVHDVLDRAARGAGPQP